MRPPTRTRRGARTLIFPSLPPPVTGEQPAALVLLSLSSLPRTTNLSNLGPPNLSRSSCLPGNPTKYAVSEQPPGVGSHPHLSRHQGAAASRRQVLPTLGSALDSPVNANLWSPGSSPEAAGSPWWWQCQQQQLCPTLPVRFQGSKNYFAATMRCGRPKNPFSNTKLRDRYLLPVWSTLCAPISPTVPPSKKSLGNPELLFLRVHEIRKAEQEASTGQSEAGTDTGAYAHP